MRIKKAAKILPLFFAPPPRINFLLQLRQFHFERKPLKKNFSIEQSVFPSFHAIKCEKAINRPGGKSVRNDKFLYSANMRTTGKIGAENGCCQ
jgi:hypothetical protein